MQVLVVGSGGREHALCWAIARSPLCERLYCAPGNAGIAEIAECLPIATMDLEGLTRFSANLGIDLVVIGPEDPLNAGLVDRLRAAGIRAFGPSARAAAIEGSKGFMKDLCARQGVPTAAYGLFDEPDAAKEFIHRHGAPLVVKADGLAAGKGVILCHNVNEAFAAVDHMMIEGAFGDAGREVVIEDLLVGEEASFFALVHGARAVPLATAQDYKPAFDGDLGPNTGGMGAYSPAPVITQAMITEIMQTIIQPTIEGLAADQRPFTGLLYAGLMITAAGPLLLEFNARFGDPECQPLLMRLKSDLLPALLACADGRMDDIRLDWHDEAALLVVLATRGYPGPYAGGSVIRGIEKAAMIENVEVFHAGTKALDGRIVANGGRVLGVGARAATIEEAQRRAYEAVACIDWPEGFYRRDIGWRAIARERQA
ncbi:MAG: phosphoribosylamine--glycine ligase [Defluviicoccus sp.]